MCLPSHQGFMSSVNRVASQRSRILSLFILTSLDGKVARQDGSIDWIWTKPVEGPNSDCGFGKFMSSVTQIVTGRKTFDVSSSFEDKPFPGKQKTVFTRRYPLPSANNDEVQYTNNDPVEVVAKMKQSAEDGKIWLLGGADIAKQLHDADLIDEIILTIQPIILGPGVSLFDELKLETHWSLESVENWREGLVQLTYIRIRDQK